MRASSLVQALTLIAALAASAACGGGSNDDNNGGQTAVPSVSATGAATASATPSAQSQNPQGGNTKSYAAEPPMMIDVNKQYVATIKTEVGDLRLELFAKDAPRTVNNFVFLARDGFYDGVTFHRVIPGFVAQAGDPTGTGAGGPGYTIPDEISERKFVDGSLGMARKGQPNTGGSQWFICYGPQPHLDGAYTVFGQLVAGRDVLDKIAPHEGTDAQPGTRIQTIVIEEQ